MVAVKPTTESVANGQKVRRHTVAAQAAMKTRAAIN
jgi:hypothetical protein